MFVRIYYYMIPAYEFAWSSITLVTFDGRVEIARWNEVR